MRVNITLEHKESGERLYLTSKNKRNTPDRLQLKKSPPTSANTWCAQKKNKKIKNKNPFTGQTQKV